MRQKPVVRRSRLVLLDIMGAVVPATVALASFASFDGAGAAFFAAVLTVATYCIVFPDPR